MTEDEKQFIRVAKRVCAATGYLELGMAQHALDSLTELGPLGPFEAEIELLRGEALRRQRRFEDAAVALKAAADKLPAPQDVAAWLALSLCQKRAGDMVKAINTLAKARGARPFRRF
jgi:tetratricopeptide (TPR) repeat protein